MVTPMKGFGDMGKMVKQAQEMQARMLRVQEELALKEVEASAGGGAVTVRMTGKQEIVGIKIRPDAVDPDDVEMLEDLILAACREAQTKAGELARSELAKVTGGLPLPGGLF
jgi:DNA-binding YbaB/EbfC family protein